MSWGPNGIGVGKVWERGALDILGDLFVNGNEFKIKDGVGYMNGTPVFLEKQLELWNGGLFMSAGHTARPTRKLSECPNGWLLVWSDADPGSPVVINDYNFVFSVIPKRFVLDFSGGGTYLPTPATTNSSVTKYVYIKDDEITGHADNILNGAEDVALRKIYSF